MNLLILVVDNEPDVEALFVPPALPAGFPRALASWCVR
jgi:hypothetical protein